jgi:hypothetical protein
MSISSMTKSSLLKPLAASLEGLRTSFTQFITQVLKVESLVMPYLSVTFPCFTSPGILIGAKLAAFPCLNSITSTVESIPVTSEKAASPPVEPTVTRKFILVSG